MKKYQAVAQNILERIDASEFNDGQKIPTEEELMSYYDVSRNTIRSAMKVLVNSGKVYSRQGSGMFVRKGSEKGMITITGTTGLTHDFPNSEFKTEVVDFKLIQADEALAKKMLCNAGDDIYFITRVRIIDNIKYAIEYTYYLKPLVRYLSKEIAEQSIYQYLKNDQNLKFGFADKHLHAIKINHEQAQLLDLQEDDPGFMIEDFVYLDNGQMFNMCEMIYNYRYAKFYVAAIQ